MARKYKVLDGSHMEDGRFYKKDDTLISHRDLGRFIGKFQDLGPVEETAAQPRKAQPASGRR